MARINLRIRPAQSEDKAAICSLLLEFELPLEGLESSRIWVLQDSGGSIVGTASLEKCGKQGLLRSAAINKNMQKRGNGTALVKFVIAEARKNEMKEIYLLTITKSQLFYQKLGFEECNRERLIGSITTSAEFKGACPKTATLMDLDITKN